MPGNNAAKAGRGNEAQWLPPGRLVTVNGFNISGGMVYVGSLFAAVPGNCQPDSKPPCLIDPALKVSEAPAETPGDLNYWPSYSGITPLQRATYLTWLAGGKRDGVPVGYAFLYFYGLERRLLVDRPGCDEEALLVAEMRRLQELYGSSGSFSAHVASLLDFVELRRLSRAPGGLGAWSPDLTVDQAGFEMPMALRIKLSLHALSGVPVDFEHVMAGLLAMRFQGNGISSTVGVSRTRELFLDLARRRFDRCFPWGFPLADNRETTMVLTYRPAMQGQAFEIRADGVPRLPDPAMLAWDNARDIFNGAASELGSYAKLVREGRYPADSLIAALALPSDLADTAAAAPVAAAQQWLDRLPTPVAEVSFSALGRLCFGVGKQLLAIKQPREVSAMLARLGYGMEPDPAQGGEKPDVNVLVFRDVSTAKGLSSAFQGAALVASVLAAGRGADPARFVPELAIRLRLIATEGVRLAARQRLADRRGPTLARLRREAAGLSEEGKRDVAALAASVATACGEVGTVTIASLERLYDAFGLERRSLYAALHKGAAAGAVPAAEPVVVETRFPASGAYRIPKPPVEAAAAPNVGLVVDMAKVMAIKRETEEVFKLLAAVYEEEEASPSVPQAAEPGQVHRDEGPYPGLGKEYARLLQELRGQPEWHRPDFEAKARDFGLMPNAALEMINDWACDALGDTLIEDGDVLTVDMALLRAEKAA